MPFDIKTLGNLQDIESGLQTLRLRLTGLRRLEAFRHDASLVGDTEEAIRVTIREVLARTHRSFNFTNISPSAPYRRLHHRRG
jgi:hypothetical protein